MTEFDRIYVYNLYLIFWENWFQNLVYDWSFECRTRVMNFIRGLLFMFDYEIQILNKLSFILAASYLWCAKVLSFSYINFVGNELMYCYSRIMQASVWKYTVTAIYNFTTTRLTVIYFNRPISLLLIPITKTQLIVIALN